MNNPTYLTVSALNRYIKYQLENDTHLKKIYLKGEISNLTKHSRGHYYFSLKDESSQIRAIMFASQTKDLTFNAKDGDKVLVSGIISVYEPQGSYSINVWSMEPDGIGAFYLAFEKLKSELSEKGYFRDDIKKSIPKYPHSIGVVTSPTGAAIRDIIHTIENRYPLTKLIIYPALVQGDGAKESISKQIKKANLDQKVDVLIVGRGGGSIEDLWAFNERLVAEAIYESKIPIISAVGHETDFTISDFVSDKRAPTPTGAAVIATPDKNTLLDMVYTLKEDVERLVKLKLDQLKLTLAHLEQRLDGKNPSSILDEAVKKHQKLLYDLDRNYQLTLEYKKNKLNYQQTFLNRINLCEMLNAKRREVDDELDLLHKNFLYLTTIKKQSLDLVIESLKHQNPLKLMQQGYSITQKNAKKLTSIKEVKDGDIITTRLKDGKLTSTITKKETLL